jgi:hypothetical protein
MILMNDYMDGTSPVEYASFFAFKIRNNMLLVLSIKICAYM